jgi:predicted 3-demethylubiquinone-9 3-methyltransferase (glyoxalase superfamily)
MFDGHAEEAMRFYASLLPDSAIGWVTDRYGVSWQLSLDAGGPT